MKFNKKRIIVLCVGVILLGVTPLVCKKDKTPKVVIENVASTTIIETVDETGKIFPTQEMRINVESGATITELYVKDGDTVSKGAAIAIVSIESNSISNAARATPKLDGPASLNPAAIAQLVQQAQTPQASPEIKRVTKSITVYAPMSGVIGELGAKKGDRITSGSLGKVARTNDWEVRADVGEIDIVKVKEGQQVNIKIDALPNIPLTGYVYSITNNSASVGGLSSAVMGGNDATSYKVYIKVNVASLDSLLRNTQYTLRSGMNTTIKIETKTILKTLAIPLKAVTTRYEKTNNNAASKAEADIIVFVYKDKKVEKRKVKLGIQDINNIQVLEGLKEGEQIVVEPYEAIEKILENGTKVKTVKELTNNK